MYSKLINISSARSKIYRTHVFAFGWDGEVFKERIIIGYLSKEKIIKLQSKWDQEYGGYMWYEMVCLNY